MAVARQWRRVGRRRVRQSSAPPSEQDRTSDGRWAVASGGGEEKAPAPALDRRRGGGSGWWWRVAAEAAGAVGRWRKVRASMLQQRVAAAPRHRGGASSQSRHAMIHSRPSVVSFTALIDLTVDSEAAGPCTATARWHAPAIVVFTVDVKRAFCERIVAVKAPCDLVGHYL